MIDGRREHELQRRSKSSVQTELARRVHLHTDYHPL